MSVNAADGGVPIAGDRPALRSVDEVERLFAACERRLGVYLVQMVSAFSPRTTVRFSDGHTMDVG